MIAAFVVGMTPPALADGGAGGAGFAGDGAGGAGATGFTGNPGGSGTNSPNGGGGGGGGGAGGGAGGTGGNSGGASGGAGGAGGTVGSPDGQSGFSGAPGIGPGGGAGGGGGGGYNGNGAGAATITNTSPLAGGNGGAGGAPGGGGPGGGGGGGGAGGYGAVVTGTGASSNTNTISGGTGGAGGPANASNGGNGGGGGVAIQFTTGSATFTNSGTITGGAGGGGGASTSGTPGTAGAGGAGIVGSGLAITDSGAITGGLSGDGVTRANAVIFTGGTNVLQLQAGYTITGNVVAFSGADMLQLGGASAASFDVSQFGASAQYQNFASFQMTGSGAWTLTGTNTAALPWAVNAGTLAVDGAMANSTLTVNNGGTLAGAGTVGAVTVANGGTFAPAFGLPGNAMNVSGNLVFSAGALHLVEINTSSTSSARVSGSATLAGSVDAVFAAGTYAATSYDILHAAGGLSGTFSGVSGNVPAGFAATLTYTPTDVFLNLVAVPPAPTVTSVSPNSGPAGGGTSVAISGSSFTGATAVSFGGTAAASFTVASDTSITATSPAGSAGAVDVTVTTPGGTSATGAADVFTYVAAPAVTSVSPNSGPASGGTVVTVGGSNFANASAVKFGTNAATSFSITSASSISATAPPGTGTVDVTVTTPDGTSATSAADQFTYSVVPIVSAVSPNGGPPAGGTAVTITGANFTGATAVSFGGRAATGFVVNSATQINAISPAGSNGAVDVTVTTGNGTSAVTAADRFTYASPRLTQQGAKLIGSGASGPANQGIAVALSSDGNTGLVGGYQDTSGTGAVWVFTRSAGNWSQQGQKLVGTNNVGAAQEGYAVALAADGNTALVGGYQDNSGAGAVWVFTRTNGTWTQQGNKLTPSGENGAGSFGIAVALSSDGNTALIGGAADNGNAGAAWIFTRNGSSWAQQGTKLTGTGAIGNAGQGIAVALSADATTALIGGANDNAGTGATWVFTQSGGVWMQQGQKLAGSDNAGPAAQGYAVSLSADGNTALIGGYADNAESGAAWVFARSGGVWSQVGQKLVGTGATGNARQGFAVALSADASTAALGGYEDNALNGDVWVFTQSSGTWTQKGAKLAGTDNVGAAQQGIAVALSQNGSTLLEGGPLDNSGAGAAWVLVPSRALVDTHDFNGDGMSDIAWRDTTGDIGVWLMNGATISQMSGVANVLAMWTAVGQRDFDGDGKADILWQDTSGDVGIWLMNGASVAQSAGIGNVPAAWSVAGTGDFNGDGKGDILWHDTAGNVGIWLMNGMQIVTAAGIGNAPPNVWSIAGVGDFNGDGKSDVLWIDSSGDVGIWLMNGTQVTQAAGIGKAPPGWSIVGTGDFNGDGTSDILWRDGSGDIGVWLISNGQVTQATGIGSVPAVWSVAETGDFNGDGNSDILWRDTSGNVGVWFMNGAAIASATGIANVPTVWSIQGAGAD